MIEWIDNKVLGHSPKVGVEDVKISTTKFHGYEYISVSFRNGLDDVITDGHGRMVVGFDYNTMKVYFRSPNQDEIGYKVTSPGKNSKRKRIAFKMPNGWTAKMLCSNYKIMKDDLTGLHYIDLCKKLNKTEENKNDQLRWTV